MELSKRLNPATNAAELLLITARSWYFQIIPSLKAVVIAITNMSALGSDSWICASGYDEGDELHTRVTDFVKRVDWDSLTNIASSLRNGFKCTLSAKYSVGHFNLVRKLVFEDGVGWVARLRMPLLQNVFGTREALDVASSMRIEFATAKFLK